MRAPSRPAPGRRRRCGRARARRRPWPPACGSPTSEPRAPVGLSPVRRVRARAATWSPPQARLRPCRSIRSRVVRPRRVSGETQPRSLARLSGPCGAPWIHTAASWEFTGAPGLRSRGRAGSPRKGGVTHQARPEQGSRRNPSTSWSAPGNRPPRPMWTRRILAKGLRGVRLFARAPPGRVRAGRVRWTRAKEGTSVGERVDPITVSVIQHRLEAIVQEMGEAMLRTSYSQILNSSRDFSTALCDAEGRLVAQAEHVPIHVGAIPWAVRSVQEFFGDRVRPGDVYLLNDPYHGNNHLPDLTAFVPVFAQRPARVLVDQPLSSERHRRRDPRRLQSRGDRDLAGGPPHHAAPPVRGGGGAGRRAEDDRDQRPPSARLPGGPGRDDRLRPGGGAPAPRASRRVRRPDRRPGDRRDPRRRRAPGARLHRGMEGRRVPGRGGARRRRPRVPGHPHPGEGDQARERSHGRSQRFPSPGDRLRELVLPEHALGRRHGPRVPDRPRDAEERRDVPPAHGDRQGRHGRVGEPAGAA